MASSATHCNLCVTVLLHIEPLLVVVSASFWSCLPSQKTVESLHKWAITPLIAAEMLIVNILANRKALYSPLLGCLV